MGEVVEPGDPIGEIARATGMSVSGLLDGALVLKVHRGWRVEQIRVSEGGSIDPERTGLQLRYPVDAILATATPRLCNLAVTTIVRKRLARNL